MVDARSSVLIIGGDGFIGRSLKSKLENVGRTVFSTTRRLERVCSTRPYLDLLRPELTVGQNILKNVSQAIICGAVTSISKCEKEPIATHSINVEGVASIAQMIVEKRIELIYLSSSAVFNGSSESPLPSDHPSPSCEYGRQKLAAEQYLTALGKPLKIIRLTKVVNPTNSVFSSWIHDLRSGSEIAAFDNVHVAPISIEYCTSFIAGLLSSNETGTFHAAASRALTYYEIANYIALKLGLDPHMVKSIKNGDNGAYANKGAHLGGVLNDSRVPPQPSPKVVINNLIYGHGKTRVLY